MSRDRHTLPLLLLLTVLAGVLRFTSLDRPSIWGDEAAVYGRVAGTYQQLLDQLRDAAFPPLHYELEWWIGQGLPYWGHFDAPANGDGSHTFTPTLRLIPGGIRLTPFALRFIPAAAGTLFVPAMFWLAVQLFGRRVALLTAMVTCFSAYALVFSRDAKMYMHFWLFLTLHVSSCLWWVRTQRALPWAIWVVCGVIMVGLHGTGYAILLVDALIVFSSPRQHWFHLYHGARTGFWTAAFVPAFTYEKWKAARRTGETLVRQRVAGWRRDAWQRFQLPAVVPFAVGLLIIAAASQGPLGFYSSFSPKIQRVAADDSSQVDTGELGINWVGPYNAGRKLPDYLLYTSSAFLTGWEWPRNFLNVDYQGRPINANEQDYINPQRLWLLQTGVTGLLGLLTIGIIPWRRLFSRGRARLDRIRQDGRVWPAFRTRRVWWLGLWVTVVPCVFYTQSIDVPLNVLDGVAKVMLNTPPTVNWPRCPSIPGDEAVTAVVSKSFASLKEQWPPAWQAYRAAWTPDNPCKPAVYVLVYTLVGWLLLVLLKRKAIGRGTLRLLCVLAVLVIVTALISLAPRKTDGIIWMPRYVGLMLPAFFVLVAALIDRQPVLIRWLTIVLFLGLNLGQFSMRVWGDSEPPTGLIAADVVASQPQAIVPGQPKVVTVRAYTDLYRFRNPEPGGGSLFTPAGRYYLRMLSGVAGNLFGVRSVMGAEPYEHALQIRGFSDAQMIERDLAASPEVDRFVVWTAMPMGESDLSEPIGDRLAGRFRRVSDEVWTARDHWRWVERFQVRRRTYERVHPAASSMAR